MTAETKERESWTEQESSGKDVSPFSQLKLSRVYRFIDQQTGAAQISDFPDSNPAGDTPLEIRMKHFTEIENFSFLAYVLGHQLGGDDSSAHSDSRGLTSPGRGVSKLRQRGKDLHSDRRGTG